MPADDQQHAAEALLEQQDDQCCVNCGVAGLPASCYRRHPLHGDYCSACYSYSASRSGRARPEPLWQRQRHRMLEVLDPNALRCTHCGRLPKEGELFHKCRHPRNKRPLCGTCHHYAWRKDGLMRPWELVAREPHMRDDSGQPAQQAIRSGRPGTVAAVAPSAAAASREEAAAAVATGGGGHSARRGRPIREMSEAEQEAWHAAWQLPAGYLPANAVPQRRRAAGRRRSGGSAGGQPDGAAGEDAADEEQAEQQGRRQLWQQLVAWDGEAEAGEEAVQQEQGRQRVRPEDWEAPLHGARWEAPALPAAGRRRSAVGEAATGGEQQQGQRWHQRQPHGQQQQQQPQQKVEERQQEQQRGRQRLQQPALPPPTPQRPAQQQQQQQGEQARPRSQRQLALPAPPLLQQQSHEQGQQQQQQDQIAAVQPPPQRPAQQQVALPRPPQPPQEQDRRQQQQQRRPAPPQRSTQQQQAQQSQRAQQPLQPPAQRQAAQGAQQAKQQQPQQPAQRQAPQRQQAQHAQQPTEPPAVEHRPAARAPVALASLGLQEADLFGDAVAARAQPSPPQPQRVLTVRRAAPVQAPSRSEMQALLQAEREAELSRVQQQLEAQMELSRQQRHHATFGAQWSIRPACSGGSNDTWGAAARDNLQGGGGGEEEEEGEEQGWQQAEWQEGDEEEGEEVQQPTEQAQRREAKRRKRQRQRWRRRQRRRQEEEAQQRQEQEGEEEEWEEDQQEGWDVAEQPRPIPIHVSEEQVTAALEAELARGQHPELQPLPASLRRQLGVPNCRFAGRTVCVSGITEVVMDWQDEEARRERLEARVIAALTNCPETIEAVYLFRGAESTAWEADVRFVSAQDAARVLRFKLGLQMHGSPVTLRPDPDEVKYERHKLWRLKQTQMWVDDAIRTVVAAGDAALLARLQALKGL